MTDYEYELLNMSEDQMNQIANGDDSSQVILAKDDDSHQEGE